MNNQKRMLHKEAKQILELQNDIIDIKRLLTCLAWTTLLAVVWIGFDVKGLMYPMLICTLITLVAVGISTIQVIIE